MVHIPVNYREDVTENVILPLEVLYVDGVKSKSLRKNVGIRAIYVEDLALLAQAPKRSTTWYKSLTASLGLRRRFDVCIQRPEKRHWEILARHRLQINNIMQKVGICCMIGTHKSFWENLEADRNCAYCYNFKLNERMKVQKSTEYFSLFIVDLSEDEEI